MAVHSLLHPTKPTVTIDSVSRAAAALGVRLEMRVVAKRAGSRRTLKPQSLGPVSRGRGRASPRYPPQLRWAWLHAGAIFSFPLRRPRMRAPGHVSQARRVPCCQGQNSPPVRQAVRPPASSGPTAAAGRSDPPAAAGGAGPRRAGGLGARHRRRGGRPSHELARAGAERVTSVDASTAYLQAARSEAERLGYLPRWQSVRG